MVENSTDTQSSTLNWWVSRWWLVAVLAVALLAFGLRLLFIFEYSQIVVVWDAGLYWDRTREVQSTLCDLSGLCDPLLAEAPTMSDTLALIYNREGVLPLLLGVLISIFPAEPETVYVFNALLDALACLLVISSARLLNLPRWTALLAGLLLAVHVPVITGSGAILQQPLLRFALIGVLWAYLHAFKHADDEQSDPRLLRRWVVIGGLFTLLAGFSSLTVRPLIWLVFAAVILMGLWERHNPRLRSIARGQAIMVALTVVMINVLLTAASPVDFNDAAIRYFSGLSSSGGAQDQTTVLSFEHFWPPSSWQTTTNNPTESVFSDFANAPVDFAAKSAYSLYANYRYADTAYMQVFGLSFFWQTVQHLIVLVLAILGLAWLCGHPLRHIRGRAALLMLLIALYLSAAFSVISVEPRRLTVLAPFMALGAAGVVFMLSHLRLRRSKALTRVGVALIVAWLIPIPILASRLGEVGYYTQVSVRLALTFAFLVLVLGNRAGAGNRAGTKNTKVVGTAYMPSATKPADAMYHVPTTSARWRMLALPAFALLTFGIASTQNTNWYTFSTNKTRIIQSVSNIAVPDGRHPWLLLDLADADQAAMVTITVDGEVIKGPGTPMTQWTAGIPPEWSPYGTLADMANTGVTRLHWHAVPLPAAAFADGGLNIEVAAATPFTIYGDIRPLVQEDTYVGPSFSPWYDGNSFWRWQWNTVDPRIRVAQPLFGVEYFSNNWSDNLGLQTVDGAIYRAFVVMVPFGPQTNAFGAPLAAAVDTYCTDDGLRVLIAPQNDGGFHACADEDGNVSYYAGETRIGESAPSVFGLNTPQYTVVSRVDADDFRVEVVQVLARTFVANIYRDNVYVYSLAFDY